MSKQNVKFLATIENIFKDRNGGNLASLNQISWVICSDLLSWWNFYYQFEIIKWDWYIIDEFNSGRRCRPYWKRTAVSIIGAIVQRLFWMAFFLFFIRLTVVRNFIENTLCILEWRVINTERRTNMTTINRFVLEKAMIYI